MKKTLLFTSIFAIIVLTTALLFILPASAEDVVHSGQLGTLNWTLNETTGELVISGEGEMEHFSYNSSGGWRAYKSSIQAVKIEHGVTSISNNAFYHCTGLASITIPDSVTSIDCTAFDDCTNLKKVIYPNTNEVFLKKATLYNRNASLTGILECSDGPFKEEKGGCRSVVSGGTAMIALISLGGILIVSKKKKK